MRECATKYGIRELSIRDEIFTLRKSRTHKICEILKKDPLPCRWSISARVDLVNREMLEDLYSAGCFQIRFGVESGNQEILDLMEKGITLEQVGRVFDDCHDIGIETFAYFMIGYPGESEETVKQTISFAKSIKADWANFNPVSCKPGTQMFNLAVEKGYIDKNIIEKIENGQISTQETYCDSDLLPRSRILPLVNLAYRRFYIRPAYFMRMLMSLFRPQRLRNYSLGLKNTLIPRMIGYYQRIMN
jgi:radical SAM superfamily enzyme YgiQ (UPF0313 family)